MVKRVCVLRTGGDFTPHHVQVLARQVQGLVCLSDTTVPGVETIPLQYNWPGWWSKMEMFRPDIPGDVLYLDLDTVVIGDLAQFEGHSDSHGVSDFYHHRQLQSCFMWITEADRVRVWEYWMRDTEGHMRRAITRDCWGDQGIIYEALPDIKRWQDIAPGSVVSYKVHCKQGLPEDAAVVCFHGKPRPQDVKADWIPSYGN